MGKLFTIPELIKKVGMNKAYYASHINNDNLVKLHSRKDNSVICQGYDNCYEYLMSLTL